MQVQTTPGQPGHENHARVAQPEICVIDMPPGDPPPSYAEAVLMSQIPSSEDKNNVAGRRIWLTWYNAILKRLRLSGYIYVLVDIFVAPGPFVTTTLVASISANNGMELYKRGIIYMHWQCFSSIYVIDNCTLQFGEWIWYTYVTSLTRRASREKRRTQWFRGRASDYRLREPGFESFAAVLKPWASFFIVHSSSSLSCIN